MSSGSASRLTVSPLVARRVRRAVAARAEEGAVDPGGGELNIVPFLDIVTNLLLFLLATVSTVVVVAQVDAHLPPRRRGGHDAAASPAVSVTLTERGIVVAGPGGFVAPGCASTTRSSAFAVGPRAWSALSACMEAVHDRVGDDRVIVSADPHVPYEDLLHAMDAVRARGDRRLFDHVLISAGVR